MQALKSAFDSSSTGLTLFPYQVIPMRVNADKAPGGIIECVPDVKSRDEVTFHPLLSISLPDPL
jgi:hypothetical protein